MDRLSVSQINLGYLLRSRISRKSLLCRLGQGRRGLLQSLAQQHTRPLLVNLKELFSLLLESEEQLDRLRVPVVVHHRVL